MRKKSLSSSDLRPSTCWAMPRPWLNYITTVFFWNSDKRTLMLFYTMTSKEGNFHLRIFAIKNIITYLSVFRENYYYFLKFCILKNICEFSTEKIPCRMPSMEFSFKYFMPAQRQKFPFLLPLNIYICIYIFLTINFYRFLPYKKFLWFKYWK